MALSIFFDKPVYRWDDPANLQIYSSGYDAGVGQFGFIKVADWNYLYASASPLGYKPPNRGGVVPVMIRKASFGGAWLYDSGVQQSVVYSNGIEKTANEGLTGAYYNSALSSTRCSLQARTTSDYLVTGISLQNSTAGIVHSYNHPNVIHGIVMSNGALATIWEVGTPRKSFKYATGDGFLIELDNGIVRYYRYRTDGFMELLRTTRSKLTAAPRAEVLTFYVGSALQDLVISNDATEPWITTTFENLAVASSNLFWQRWNNQRSISPLADTLEMADKRTQYTYPNSKTELRSLQLTPRAKTNAQRLAIEDFYRWHKNDKEFIFIDKARRDANGNFEEWFARFNSPITDASLNRCIFDESVSIIEDFRNI